VPHAKGESEACFDIRQITIAATVHHVAVVGQRGGTVPQRTIVLGVGNTLLTDDGVGVHAIRDLQTRCGERSDLDLVDAGTLSFTLAASLEGHDGLIVIDAAELEASPGTIGEFEGIAMDRFLAGNRKLSVHEVSLLDLLAMARLADELPANRALIGVQPERIGWGEVPTATVAAAIPDVSRVALSLIERWNAHAA